MTSTRGDKRSRWEVRVEREFWDSGAAAKAGPTAGMVYLALRAHEDGTTRISPIRIATVAEKTGIGKTAVRAAIARLVEMGWVAVKRRPGGSSTYVLGDRDGYFVDDEYPSQPGTPPDSGAPPLDSPLRNPARTPPDSGAPKAYDPSGFRRTPLRIPAHTPPESGAPGINTSPLNTSQDKTPVASERPKRKTKAPARPQSRGESVAQTTPPPPSAVASARAKGPGRALTGEELVELWRERYAATFGSEDLDLRTKTARKRAGIQLLRRTVDWFAGDQGQMRRYLGETLLWWKVRQERGEKFPGGLPTLKKLAEQKPGGEASWFVKHWRSGRMAAERGEAASRV